MREAWFRGRMSRLGPTPARPKAGRNVALALIAALASQAAPAHAAPGFYVARSDARLVSKVSRIVLTWDNGRTSLTMASDYEGDPKSFALVVPVPDVIAQKDIRAVKPELLDKIDAYSAPRLAQFYDYDPCAPGVAVSAVMPEPKAGVTYRRKDAPAPRSVDLASRYEVGVYDIVVLSDKESGEVQSWLKKNDYRVPPDVGPLLDAYVAKGMHFLVAKVNLDRQKRAGDGLLPPLQVSYRSKTFMLPIRLGMADAEGTQDLVILVLSRNGRVETANYRTVGMPSGAGLPLFVESEFGAVYKAIFDRQVENDGMSTVFMEYARDMRNACHPCGASAPTAADLFALGARWQYPELADADAAQLAKAKVSQVPPDTFITRLHLRYDARQFPADLVFSETPDRDPYRTIFKLQHPVRPGTCAAGREYRGTLAARFVSEGKALARLTGWSLGSIHRKMEASGESIRLVE